MLENARGDLGLVIHERCAFLPVDFERMYYKPGTLLIEVPRIKDGVATRLVGHLADAASYPIEYEYPYTDSVGGLAPSTTR